MSILTRYGGALLASPLWTPSRANVALWFDAADAATITLNGNTVSQWQDKSGNGRHISQSTASQQPTYVAGQLNGLPVISFDGSNDVLLSSTVGASGVQNITIMAVMRLDISSGEDIPIGIGQTSNIGAVRGLWRNGGSFIGFAGWNRDAVSSYSWDLGSNLFNIVGVYNPTLAGPDNVFITKNGLTASFTASSGSLVGCVDGFSVGALQGAMISAYYSLTRIAEIAVFYRSLLDTDRQKLEGYFAHKWGLTNRLPSDHPFRARPPRV